MPCELTMATDFEPDLKDIFVETKPPDRALQELRRKRVFELWRFVEFVDDVTDWTAWCQALGVTEREDIAAMRGGWRKAENANKQKMEKGSENPNAELDEPIDSKVRQSLMDKFTIFYHFVLSAKRQPSDRLLGRVKREKDRCSHTVINLNRCIFLSMMAESSRSVRLPGNVQLKFGTSAEDQGSGDLGI